MNAITQPQQMGLAPCPIRLTYLGKPPGVPRHACNHSEKAHFWALFVLLRSCQAAHEALMHKPTLAEVFKWIAPNYETARLLPDHRMELVPPGDQKS
jgi:hypothetical protein